MKKETIKFVLQILISILTAIVTALGTASCVRAMYADNPQAFDTIMSLINPEGNPE